MKLKLFISVSLIALTAAAARAEERAAGGSAAPNAQIVNVDAQLNAVNENLARLKAQAEGIQSEIANSPFMKRVALVIAFESFQDGAADMRQKSDEYAKTVETLKQQNVPASDPRMKEAIGRRDAYAEGAKDFTQSATGILNIADKIADEQAKMVMTISRFQADADAAKRKAGEYAQTVETLKKQNVPASDPRMKEAIGQRDMNAAIADAMKQTANGLFGAVDQQVKDLFSVGRAHESAKEAKQKSDAYAKTVETLRQQNVPASDPRMREAIGQRDTYAAMADGMKQNADAMIKVVDEQVMAKNNQLASVRTAIAEAEKTKATLASGAAATATATAVIPGVKSDAPVSPVSPAQPAQFSGSSASEPKFVPPSASMPGTSTALQQLERDLASAAAGVTAAQQKASETSARVSNLQQDIKSLQDPASATALLRREVTFAQKDVEDATQKLMTARAQLDALTKQNIPQNDLRMVELTGQLTAAQSAASQAKVKLDAATKTASLPVPEVIKLRQADLNKAQQEAGLARSNLSQQQTTQAKVEAGLSTERARLAGTATAQSAQAASSTAAPGSTVAPPSSTATAAQPTPGAPGIAIGIGVLAAIAGGGDPTPPAAAPGTPPATSAPTQAAGSGSGSAGGGGGSGLSGSNPIANDKIRELGARESNLQNEIAALNAKVQVQTALRTEIKSSQSALQTKNGQVKRASAVVETLKKQKVPANDPRMKQALATLNTLQSEAGALQARVATASNGLNAAASNQLKLKQDELQKVVQEKATVQQANVAPPAVAASATPSPAASATVPQSDVTPAPAATGSSAAASQDSAAQVTSKSTTRAATSKPSTTVTTSSSSTTVTTSKPTTTLTKPTTVTTSKPTAVTTSKPTTTTVTTSKPTTTVVAKPKLGTTTVTTSKPTTTVTTIKPPVLAPKPNNPLLKPAGSALASSPKPPAPPKPVTPPAASTTQPRR